MSLGSHLEDFLTGLAYRKRSNFWVGRNSMSNGWEAGLQSRDWGKLWWAKSRYLYQPWPQENLYFLLSGTCSTSSVQGGSVEMILGDARLSPDFTQLLPSLPLAHLMPQTFHVPPMPDHDPPTLLPMSLFSHLRSCQPCPSSCPANTHKSP